MIMASNATWSALSLLIMMMQQLVSFSHQNIASSIHALSA